MINFRFNYTREWEINLATPRESALADETLLTWTIMRKNSRNASTLDFHGFRYAISIDGNMRRLITSPAEAWPRLFPLKISLLVASSSFYRRNCNSPSPQVHSQSIVAEFYQGWPIARRSDEKGRGRDTRGKDRFHLIKITLRVQKRDRERERGANQ